MVRYEAIRKFIKVGDVIGCRSGGLFGRAIRYFKGGKWDLSHVSIIFRDATDKEGRVEVLEALSKGGLQRNFLSRVYHRLHGDLFWIPMECDEDTRKKIVELGVKILEKKIKYDLRTTWMAAILPIFVDAKKFNCSEVAWYLLTRAGRLHKRYDKKGREIAPVPGDLPSWADSEPIEISIGKKDTKSQ